MAKYFALDKAAFIELWVETALYGINTALFSQCLHVFRRSSQRRTPTRASKLIIATATIIYILCSAHAILDFARAIIGFFHTPDGAVAYYNELWTPSSISKQALFTAACVADAVLVYRLFVIWNLRVGAIIVPTLLLLAAFMCSIGTVCGFSHIQPGETTFHPVISNWAIPAYVLHLTFNVVVNGLIIGRLWWLRRDTSKILGKEHGQKYKRILVSLIESGLLHTLTLFFFMVLYLLKSNAVLIVYGAFAQIVGIAPTLIVYRVCLEVSIQDRTSDQSNFDISLGQGDQDYTGRSPKAISMLHFHQEEDEISLKNIGPGAVV